MVLGYISIVIICDSQIKQNIQEEWEIQKNSIHPENFFTSNILNRHIDSKYPQRLDQQIKKYDQNQIGYKLSPQVFIVLFPISSRLSGT